MQPQLGLPGNVLGFVADGQAFLPAERETDYVRPVLIRPGGFHQHRSEIAIAVLVIPPRWMRLPLECSLATKPL